MFLMLNTQWNQEDSKSVKHADILSNNTIAFRGDESDGTANDAFRKKGMIYLGILTSTNWGRRSEMIIIFSTMKRYFHSGFFCRSSLCGQILQSRVYHILAHEIRGINCGWFGIRMGPKLYSFGADAASEPPASQFASLFNSNVDFSQPKFRWEKMFCWKKYFPQKMKSRWKPRICNLSFQLQIGKKLSYFELTRSIRYREYCLLVYSLSSWFWRIQKWTALNWS